MEAPQQAQLHVAMLPTPGMGHLIPLTELARKLFKQHSSIKITFIIPNDGTHMEPQKALLKSIPSIKTIFLPTVNFDDLPEDTLIETRIGLSVIRSLTDIRKALMELHGSTHVSAFMVDFFGTFTFDVVKDLEIPFYMFFPSPAMVLSLGLHINELDESCTCEFRDLPEPIKLPGCYPVNGQDLVDCFQDRKGPGYQVVIEMCKSYRLVKGILINGFWELEPNTYKAFEEDASSNHDKSSEHQDSGHVSSSQRNGSNGLCHSSKIPRVYPVGPLVRSQTVYKDDDEDKPECLKWLDKQPIESVLFVSFGSGGTLSKEQWEELALGLEMSGQRFLLVVKSTPNDKAKSAAYFSSNDKNKLDPFEFLPSGFLERTKEKGFLLSEWAPQIEVLSHKAVGGFVTHCGWNSTLESIVHGVPLIAWPLFGEQKMNAVLLSEDLKVAFRVRENENGVVDREEIGRLVRSLFEGEEGKDTRNRMRNFKKLAAQALSQDGASTKSLASVVEKWRAAILHVFYVSDLQNL